MQDLIATLTPDGPRVDSRTLSPHLDVRHRSTFLLIKEYLPQMEELGQLPIKTEIVAAGNQTLSSFQMTKAASGRPQSYALLNEDQCYFLLTLVRNTGRAVALKLKLVKAFRDARAQLAQRDVARLEGKAVRRLETDSIAALVDYAKGQGSANADMYYLNITRMTHDLLGIPSGQRDTLDATTLKKLSMAETLVDLAIRDGIKAALHYKQIRALAKDRLTGLVPLLAPAQ